MEDLYNLEKEMDTIVAGGTLPKTDRKRTVELDNQYNF